VYRHYRNEERAYRRRIHKQLYVDLPAIIPQLGETTEFDPVLTNLPPTTTSSEYSDITFVPPDPPLHEYMVPRNGTGRHDSNPPGFPQPFRDIQTFSRLSMVERDPPGFYTINGNKYRMAIQDLPQPRPSHVLRTEDKILPLQGTSVGTNSEEEPHSREKRSFGLLGIIGGVNSLVNTVKIEKMKHVMNIMKQRVDVNTRQIKIIDQDLSALARCTLLKITAIKNKIDWTNRRINSLTTVVTQLNAQLSQNSDLIMENRNAIKVLTLLVGQLMTLSERNLSQYQELIEANEHFMDAMDHLSTGHLSHNVIGPGQLRGLMTDVASAIKRTYWNYELVMTQVQEFYDLPIITFAYQEGMLLLNIPIFIKPIQQQALTLYNIRTVPVPFHIRHEGNIDPEQNQNSYTWYRPTHEVLGMSDTNFISLPLNQLDTCMHIGTGYFCEGLMLMKQRDTHTCESAIFWDMPPELIRQKCKFQYYKHLVPEPTILDAGNEVLLAGLPLPWKFLCNHDQEIPKPLTGAKYAIIAKKDLCLCSISAGDYFLQENIITCQGDSPRDRDFQMKFTINNAVKIFFPEKFKNFVPLDVETNLSLEPYPDQVIDLDIIANPDEDVIEQYNDGVDMEDLVNKIDEHGQAYIHQVEKIGDIPNMSTWFSGKHKAFGILLVLGCLAVVALVIGGILWYKYNKTTHGMKAVNHQLSSLSPVATLLATKFPGAQAVVTEDQLKGILDTILEQTESIQTIMKRSPFTWEFAAYTIALLGALVIGCLLFLLAQKVLRWVHVNWLLSPSYKSATFGCRLWVNQTDLYIELTNTQKKNQVVHLYLGSVEGYPSQVTCTEHKYKIGGFSYIRNGWFDILNISWNNMVFILDGEERFYPPSCIYIPVLQKFAMRRMIMTEGTRYQLYLRHGNEVMVLSGHYSVNLYDSKTESELKALCKIATEQQLQKLKPGHKRSEPSTSAKDIARPAIKPRTSLVSKKTPKIPKVRFLPPTEGCLYCLHGSPEACTCDRSKHPEPDIVPEISTQLFI
jgi:hypothetical protein